MQTIFSPKNNKKVSNVLMNRINRVMKTETELDSFGHVQYCFVREVITVNKLLRQCMHSCD